MSVEMRPVFLLPAGTVMLASRWRRLVLRVVTRKMQDTEYLDGDVRRVLLRCLDARGQRTADLLSMTFSLS